MNSNPAPSSPRLRWHLHELPAIRIAVRARHHDRDFSPLYCADTHALHVYAYPAVFKLDEQRFDLLPGQYTLTPAGARAAYDMPAAGHHWCVHFRGAGPTSTREGGRGGAAGGGGGGGGGRLEIPCIGWPAFHPAESPLTAAEQCARIALLASSRSPSQRHRARLLLQDLLLNLAAPERVTGRRGPPEAAHPAVIQAARRLQSRLAEPLDVPALARHVELSQNYLARQFRAYYGQTMQQYQARQRIARADLLLRTTGQPVKAIAAEVGYTDPHHFNKTFRRIMGQSPTRRRYP